MQQIMVLGAGKVGLLVAILLHRHTDFQVILVDRTFPENTEQYFTELPQKPKCLTCDLSTDDALNQLLSGLRVEAMISCLPFYLNQQVVKAALAHECHYFDLTEDVAVTECVKQLSKNTTKAFVPQCGLAPGMVGLLTYHVMEQFDDIQRVKMRVGALPQHTDNALKYALTWSTEGLINEYCNPSQAIQAGQQVSVPAMASLETLTLDGQVFEAFNTSGGLGSLAFLCEGKVQSMDYKTLRYPGHCEKMRFLLQDLNLQQHRQLLKQILETSIPRTFADQVILYVSVMGQKAGELINESRYLKIMPQSLYGQRWSAIQIATAAGLCGVIQEVLSHQHDYQGFVYQECLPYERLMQGIVGHFYQQSIGVNSNG